MEQRSFAEVRGFRRQEKVTRREKFLEEMERVMPWKRLEARIVLVYPVAGNGRRPYPLATMLRIHLMQQWFGYSDAAMEDALHDEGRNKEPFIRCCGSFQGWMRERIACRTKRRF